MKNEKNEGRIEKMKMNREIKFAEYKQIDNQLINIFINDWLRIVNDGNRNKNGPNYTTNKVQEWMFLSRISG
jgi:uncharacterized protein (DUF927 family)